jgi:adenylate cyclase
MRGIGRGRLAVAVAGVAIGITLLCYAGDVLHSLELKTVDARFDIRGSTGTPDDVAVVAIDARTFADLADWGRLKAIRSGSVLSQLQRVIDGIQHAETRDVTVSSRAGLGAVYHVALAGAARWPFKRHYYQLALDRIEKGRPSAVVFDIQFTEPTDPYEDNALINAVARAGKVVLSTTEVTKGGHTQIFGGDSVLRQIGARPGFGNVPSDSDGVTRRVAFSHDGLTSLGIVAAEVASGKAIPQPGTANPWIDFAGPPGTVETYSFFRVMDGQIPPSAFRGKVVVIGASAPVLQDLHSTSTSGTTSGSLMAGPELQANVASTALHGFPLRSLWSAWNFVLIVLFALIAPLASLKWKGWRAPALAVGVGALFVVAAQLAFNHGRVVTLTYPLLALGISAIGVLVSEYLLEAFERVRTHDTFSRFVPEAVVNQVLERTGGELRLGGELVEGTAMFTDLRGFTTFSEGLPADEVIGLLNGYLGEISDAVLANGGTLVSYLGDGLMAVFGAPLPQPDHADRALAAAREMLEVRLPKYNETLREKGFERGFKMGIGLNSGPFMSGNVGSQRRLEYTAIGDTINTASRIEGMTKGTPYALYLADSTREALQTPVDDLVYIDEMPVRGRTHPIKLWSLSADYVQKENWEAEVAKAEPKPAEASTTEGSEEPVPA